MKSLAHTPHCRRASERLAEVCLRYRPTSSSCPQTRLTSAIHFALAQARRLLLHGLDHPDNFYNPLSLHSICISTASAAPAASF